MSTPLLGIYDEVKDLAGERWDDWAKEFSVQGVDPSYFPMWLKRQSLQGRLENYWAELADYCWSKFWVKRTKPVHEKRDAQFLMLNPLARIHRFDFDIENWIKEKTPAPTKKMNALIVSEKGTLEADVQMAALLDELSDEPQSEQSLLMAVSKQFGAERPWEVALGQLKSYSVIIGGKL